MTFLARLFRTSSAKRELLEQRKKEALRQAIRSKLANYTPTPTNSSISGIVVTDVELTNLEMHPAVCSLVETAWADKSSFLQFVHDIAFGEIDGITLSHTVFGELEFLKELVRDQFEEFDPHTSAVTSLTIEQRRQIDIWAGAD